MNWGGGGGGFLVFEVAADTNPATANDDGHAPFRKNDEFNFL